MDGENAFSFHIGSFRSSAAMLKQWTELNETLCHPPRFEYHQRMNAYNPIRIYWPPLEWTKDHSDRNIDYILDPAWREAESGEHHEKHNPSMGTYPLGYTCDGQRPPMRFDTCPSSQGFQPADTRPDVARLPGFPGGFPGSLGAVPSRRAPEAQRRSPIQARLNDRIIYSNNNKHSARELCESPTSVSPDFVSLVEGKYCDMHQKELFDVCSKAVTACCFDMEKHAMNWGNCETLRPIQRRQLQMQPKKYNKVQKWSYDSANQLLED